jgi:hypothetical protein
MKNLLFSLSILLIALVSPGCHELLHHLDDDPPAAPTGVRTATGDNFIELYWNDSRDPDVEGYNVYVSSTYGGRYEYVGTVHNPYFLDEDARNGVLYYYAVSAYDYDGNESELSNDVAYDIPRPEGYDVLLYNAGIASGQAGYDFSKYAVVSLDDQYADMYFVTGTSGPVMRVDSDTDIQDLGATSSILNISQAPLNGWSTAHEVPLIAGHTYVVWTWDDHYAKFRVSCISSGRVVFDWAYQLVPSNRLLKKTPAGERHRN